MSAEIITGPSGGKRVILADVLPLDTPLLVQIFPIYACNLRCVYCHLSIPKEKRGFITDTAVMDLGLFKKVASGLLEFPSRPRVLRFVGLGEPLLHPDIVEMVRFASERKVADRTEILTNGLLLDKYMALKLVRAGLSRLVISIQGTTADKYRDICGKKIDFDGFIDTLRYIYGSRGNMKIHIKAIDCALDGKEDVERFFSLFSPVCDTISVERAGPIYGGVENNSKMALSVVNQFGVSSTRPKVCPQAFATMQINPDGKVVPCYSAEYPAIVGDANKESLIDIWRGRKLRKFQLRMLSGRLAVGQVCTDCRIIDHRMSPEDSLDGAADRLKEMYRC